MSGSFLGLKFKPVELAQRDELTAVLERHPQRLSGYTFAPLAAWNGLFKYETAMAGDDTLLIAFKIADDPQRHLLQPVGPLSESLQASLLREARALPAPLRIYGATEEFLAANPGFAGHFEVVEDPPCSNYLYPAMDLAELPGGKYAKKRNHIAHAARLYQWTDEALTPEHAAECLGLLEAIDREDPRHSPSMIQDIAALTYTLNNLAVLRQQGRVVRVDGKVAGLSIWEPLTPDMAVVHFERALRSFVGMYQVVNRETARAIALQGFKTINREEDLGDPGLRKSKLSYHPSDYARAFIMKHRRG